MATVAKRDAAHKSIVKLLKYIKTAPATESKLCVQAKYDELQKRWENFEAYHDEILEVTGKNEMDTQQAEYDRTEDVFSESVALFLNMLSKFSIQDSTLQQRKATSDDKSVVRLPKMSLPVFSGGYNQWQSFRDLFVSMVHSNNDLGDAQKLHYLKTSLSGEAECLLRNVLVTNANYAESWKMLQRRFENTRVMVFTMINDIVQQPNVTGTAESIKTMLDSTVQYIRALENLRQPVAQWDAWLVYTVVQKCDAETRLKWDESIASTTELPTWKQLETFLLSRFRALEGSIPNTASSKRAAKAPTENVRSFLVTDGEQCQLCDEKHRLYKCAQFIAKPVEDRREIMRNSQLCFNCMSPQHRSSFCRSKFRCIFCKQRHNTLLHVDQSKPNENQLLSVKSTVNACALTKQAEHQPISEKIQPLHVEMFTSSPSSSETTKQRITPNPFGNSGASSHVNSATLSTHFARGRTTLLLATALIKAYSADGKVHTLRALIDPGSMTSFITTAAVSALGLKKHPANVSIEGVGCTMSDNAQGYVFLKFKSCYNHCQSHLINAYILGSITNMLPPQPIELKNWNHLENLQLADPTYGQPGPVDVLLGADTYPSIIQNGVMKGSPGEPIAQQTTLGYIITGPTETKIPNKSSVSSFVTQLLPDHQLQRFWEIEEVPTCEVMSTEDTACEQHFVNNYKRCSNGRYMVKLPFKKPPIDHLGLSRSAAVQRLYQLEKRFISNPTIKQLYVDFINEFLTLQHMEIVPEFEVTTTKSASYYMPHHAVLKDSTTTRLRVVFDASKKTSTGISLNELMYKGPTLQHNLFSIITRWRTHFIAFTADVEKMYRQILVDPADRDFQRILWRPSTTEPIKDYRLRTVTYGMSAAPYLAVKTLQTLAKDECSRFPIASKIALRDMYVDDVCSGADDVETAILAQNQLISMFSAGGFTLRKWTSNSESVLQNIGVDAREYKFPLNVNSTDTIKTLGIAWNPATDEFEFQVNLPMRNSYPTKRTLLADTSTLFDPLGWLAPTLITAKTMFQSLWLAGLHWDDPLPEPLQSKWIMYRDNLKELENIRVNRWLGNRGSQKSIDLHGFCDASNLAYAAAIYCRVVQQDGSIRVGLVAAKTKVSPIKQISLPRLELCGALLLARTMVIVKTALEMPFVDTHTWTDSEIVLAWLADNPIRWKTFVANRTSEIQTSLINNQWHHVSSIDNPADCASRGISPSQLRKHSIWWTGPSWLSLPSAEWPSSKSKSDNFTTCEEQKLVLLTGIITHRSDDILDRFSTLTAAVRTIAMCKRFIHNCKTINIANRKCGYLKASELSAATDTCIRISQKSDFSSEIACIKSGNIVPKNSRLISLNPYIDENDIVRVGGRLSNSQLSNDRKHPVIIARSGKFAQLLISHAHAVTLHGTTQQTLMFIRHRYWILDAINQIRRFVHRCIVCFRYRTQGSQQLMADLPSQRVTPSRPFSHTGIDYAGPIQMRMTKGRGIRCLSKGYIAVFICMATKAIHLEIVSDLSTQNFIAAFKRFVSRRGMCSHIYSDNGTNFVGAATEIPRQHRKAIREQQHQFAEMLANDGVEWHFNPPSAPHFGGLWEAGVKSVKRHLRRITGQANLTLEELSTLLCQIEAALNSRPLCQLTNDIDSEEAITPGHLIIGFCPTTVPEPSYLQLQENRLTRWQHTQQLYQHFWRRWTNEYLGRLQQRPKWKNSKPNLAVGTLVLLKEENVPPSKWPLARITQVHSGRDGHTRVVTIKCNGKEFQRPIVKICPLPDQ